MIYNSQQMEMTQMLMDKENVVYPYNKILLSHKNKSSPPTCYTMDRPWQYYAEWKKAERGGHVIYDSIILNVQERQIYKGRK